MNEMIVEFFGYLQNNSGVKIFSKIAIILLLIRYIFQYVKHSVKKSYQLEQFVKDLLQNPIKRKRGFENFIPLTSNIVFDSLSYNYPTLLFQYRIPSCLVNKDQYLDLGGILALTDLVTSIVILLNDKSHRAGVSITLTGQTHTQHFPDITAYQNELKAGNIVMIRAYVTKVGYNIAFADMVISSLHGDRLASSSHMKFLPSGYM